MVFGLWLVFRKAQAAVKTNKVCDLAPGAGLQKARIGQRKRIV